MILRKPNSLTSYGLITVVNELPALTELTVEALRNGKFTLRRNTVMELGKIFRTRGRRLIIRNYLDLGGDEHV